jgi:hypothetical protein
MNYNESHVAILSRLICRMSLIQGTWELRAEKLQYQHAAAYSWISPQPVGCPEELQFIFLLAQILLTASARRTASSKLLADLPQDDALADSFSTRIARSIHQTPCQ